MSGREYFYYQSKTQIFPFGEPGIFLRNLNEEEKKHFGDDASSECGGASGGVCVTFEDNGDFGDGLCMSIFSESTKDDDPIFRAVLTLRGARSIAHTLDNLLKLRDVEMSER